MSIPPSISKYYIYIIVLNVNIMECMESVARTCSCGDLFWGPV